MKKSTQKQRGDTIVEVLLAMAVVGMVLGSSFGIANRSLQLGRSAQERTTALKIAESQIELMKSVYREEVKNKSNNFCISGGDLIDITDVTTECSELDGEGGSGIYSVVVEPPSNDDQPYKVTVSWQRFGGTAVDSVDRVTLFYRLGVL